MPAEQKPPLTCPQFNPDHLHLSTSTPLGSGAISQVVQSHLAFSQSGQKTPVAIKIISKIQVLQQNKVESVMNEKEALLRMAPFPFVSRLFGTAQSEDELFFVMEWHPHGDLLQHIRRCAWRRTVAYNHVYQQQQQEQHAPPPPRLSGKKSCAHNDQTSKMDVPNDRRGAAGDSCSSQKTGGSQHCTENTSSVVSLTLEQEKLCSKAFYHPSYEVLQLCRLNPTTITAATATTTGTRAERHREAEEVSEEARRGAGSACVGGEITDTDTNSPSALRRLCQPIPKDSRCPRCLPFRDIQLITAQLIMGLARAYEKGLVLRDLKPENIVFDDHYRACLIDFDTVDTSGHGSRPEPFPARTTGDSTEGEMGTGKHPNASSSSSSSHTHSNSASEPRKNTERGEDIEVPRKSEALSSSLSGASGAPKQRRLTVSEIQAMRRRTASFCGTAQYVSPEMLGACRWSFSSDLWALGTVVYEMVYGMPMFQDEYTFAVLTRVLQGVTPVSFPEIDFEEDETQAAGREKEEKEEEKVLSSAVDSHNSDRRDEGKRLSAFERVRDFITRLVHLNPCERLGVKMESGEMDLTALRSHCFFEDFDWKKIDCQIRDYRPHDFRNPPKLVTRSQTEEEPVGSPFGADREMRNTVMTQVTTDIPRRETATSPDVTAPLDSMVGNWGGHPSGFSPSSSSSSSSLSFWSAMDASRARAFWAEMKDRLYDDGTTSLAEDYLALPHSDPAYADYVYRATADANPFERMLFGSREANTFAEAEKKRQESADQEDACRYDGTGCGTHSEGDGNDDDDVIDDVGIQYTGPLPNITD